MRLAVIADIHGNVLALEAVLLDITHRRADMTVNLGDCVSGPLWPAETWARLQQLQMPTVRGNHDRCLNDAPDTFGASDAYAVAKLSEADRHALVQLPQVLNPLPGVLACHGTPEHDNVYLLDQVVGGGMMLATDEQIMQLLGEATEALILCGHSHQARMVQCGRRLAVNPGSVGCPAYVDDGASAGSSKIVSPGIIASTATLQTTPAHVSEAGSPHARYALLDDSSGLWSVEFVAVAYDWNRAAERALANQRPDWAQALRTGRAR